MRLFKLLRLSLLLLCGVVAFNLHAQEASLRIEGVGAQPVVLGVSELRKLKRQAIEDRRTITRGGESRESVVKWGGVLLSDVLAVAGFTQLDSHVARRAAFFAIASDNYQGVYSWGEVFNSEAGARILVLDQKEGADLDAQEGPIAIAAFADKNPGPRHVKRLIAIKVVIGAP